MVPRATVIAVLIGVEAALVYGMAVALTGGSPPPWGKPAGRVGARLASPSSFPAGAHPALAIDVGMADVTIDTHPEARIEVSVSDGGRHIGSSVPISVRADGDTIRITANETDFWSFLGDSRTVDVTVPPATAVVIANAGNVTATGLRADATINSGAHFHRGDGIRVRDFRGSLTATNADGRIEITDADCPTLHVSVANGRVTLTRVRARTIDADSSNGRIDGTGLRLRDGRVASANGRVSLGFAAGTDSTVTVGAANGHVRVSGFTAAPATFVQSSADEENDDGSPSSAQTVRVGAGSGRLDVRAGNGSIDLSQEG
jgi:hypothetical protein